jgi:hypothetical protein
MNFGKTFGKSLVAAIVLVLVSPIALGKDKPGERGMLESMQSVPCGAKERGLTGVGSVFASLGVEHVDAHEQLCPQYLLRTDEMDYHIRPLDTKHAAVLPIGQEAEFKIRKDRLLLRMSTGDRKERAYEVVSMEPPNAAGKVENSAYRPATPPPNSPPLNPAPDRATYQSPQPPPQPPPPVTPQP